MKTRQEHVIGAMFASSLMLLTCQTNTSRLPTANRRAAEEVNAEIEERCEEYAIGLDNEAGPYHFHPSLLCFCTRRQLFTCVYFPSSHAKINGHSS